MSISNNYVPIRQIGNGSTVNFSAAWAMLNASYAQVFLEDSTTHIQTPVPQGAGAGKYTIVINSGGFTVTFGTAPTNTQYVVIGRSVTQDQTVPYTTSKGFQGSLEEFSYDKLTAMVQDLSDINARSLKFQLGSASIGILPEPIDGYAIIWDGTTGTMKNTDASLAVLEGNAAIVAANIAAINAVASDLTAINAVAANATNINTVATNITAVNIAASNIAGIIAAPAAAALVASAVHRWNFLMAVTNTDPGTGNIKFDNATPSAVANIYISNLSGDTANPNLRTFIQTWDDSTSALKGTITIVDAAGNNTIYSVTGAITDNTTWSTIPVTYVSNGGTFSAATPLGVGFARAGNNGSGDVASNTAVSVDSEIALFNGTSGKSIKRMTGTGFVKVNNGVSQTPNGTIRYQEADPSLVPCGYVNVLRNSCAQIAARGPSGTALAATPAYGIDGIFIIPVGATAQWSQGTDNAVVHPLGFSARTYLNLIGNSGMTALTLVLRVESYEAGLLAGQVCTFTALIQNNSGASITPQLQTQYPTSTDNFGTMTTDLAATNLQPIANGATGLVSYTFSVSANAKQGYAANILFGGSLTSGVNGIKITMMDLRPTRGLTVGLQSAPPIPEVKPYEVEKRICERFLPYFLYDNPSVVTGLAAQCISTTQARIAVPLRTRTRAAVSAVIGFTTVDFALSTASGAQQAITGNSILNSTKDNVTMLATVASGLVAGNMSQVQVTSGAATGSIVFTGAEL